MLNEIGSGSFGVVKRALHIKADVECAIKIIEVLLLYSNLFRKGK